MKINRQELVNYSLVTLFIFLSGVPYLSSAILNILLFSLLILVFILRKKVFNTSFLFLFVMVFTLTLLQTLDFNFYPIKTNLGIYILVLNAYFIVKVLGDKYIDYYIKVMYYIAISSLGFYFLFLFLPFMENIFLHYIVPIFNVFNFSHFEYPTIIIYNLQHIHLFRNSGPFWEPGVFAGYLTIAFMFNMIKTKKIRTKINVLFLFTVLTTLSTTAYLSIFIFLSFIYYKQIKNFLFKGVVVSGIIIVGITAYTTLDFIGAKIESRLEGFYQANVLETRNSGRFVSILRDMKDFKGHEFTGIGKNIRTRYNSLESRENFVIRSNGLSDFIVAYGIIFFILAMYYLLKSICSYISTIQEKNKLLCFAVFLVLILLSWSEAYFKYGIYWSLFFLQYAYYHKEKDK